MAELTLDETKLEAFIERFIGDAAATAHAATVVLGDKLGLFRALAEGGPLTADELAARSRCHPRLIKEWVNAQAASEYCIYDPATDRYSLTPEQTACLADPDSPTFLVGNTRIVNTLHKDEEGVRNAFTGDEGFGWHEHHDDLFAAMASASSADYAAGLVPEWIPALNGVEAKLLSGACVADVGCGHGGPTIMLALAYPASTFHGFDYHAESIEAARKAAAEARVSDRVTFEVAVADSFPGEGYDLICTFDAFHDMGNPVAVARHIRSALAPDGTWMITELNAGDRVEENINPFGRFLYSASTFVCVPNALSQGSGPALGAAAGEAALHEVTTEAGFSRFRRAAEAPFNLIIEARP
ncbi:MAG: methyltransferase domain-containing protein [Actinobacteria bacterium]|nr:methyltransferase domain-containing protein [Actinomycetota bacterium]MDQ3530980.1 class I SAM-dependent methyltransferase [Actinomycetota bacterium]